MKVLFDVIGAPRGSGGPYIHAAEVLRAWSTAYPDDEIVVIGPDWVDEIPTGRAARRRIRWSNSGLPARVFGQLIVTPLVARFLRDHVLIVSLPVLSPAAPAERSYVFAHDWRHLHRPAEFIWTRRAYRAIWGSSVTRARGTFAISRKTLSETVARFPTAQTVLAENGADHALRWTSSSEPEWADRLEPGFVVTPGHRENKRAALVIDAIAELDSADRPQLVVMGAVGDLRDQLRAHAEARGVSQDVIFPGYVTTDHYAYCITRARCLIMASSDEGYGLPAAEAMILGVPVITTDDSGLREIFQGAVHAVPPSAGAIASAISAPMPRARRDRPATWTDTVRVVREAILRASEYA